MAEVISCDNEACGKIIDGGPLRGYIRVERANRRMVRRDGSFEFSTADLCSFQCLEAWTLPHLVKEIRAVDYRAPQDESRGAFLQRDEVKADEAAARTYVVGEPLDPGGQIIGTA